MAAGGCAEDFEGETMIYAATFFYAMTQTVICVLVMARMDAMR